MIVYVTDNFEYVTDFPRYYLYPFQWNRMHFTARYISLLPSKDCTTKVYKKGLGAISTVRAPKFWGVYGTGDYTQY